jgi:hypothetical protein
LTLRLPTLFEALEQQLGLNVKDLTSACVVTFRTLHRPSWTVGNGNPLFTVTQVNNFAAMTLAPPGTPLWHPQKDNFAPRLGVAWQLFPNLVLRAGGGLFYDLG